MEISALESNQPRSSTATILLKLLAFTIVIPGTVTAWLPFFILFPKLRAHTISWNDSTLIAILLITAGVVGYLWCASDFAFVGKGTPSPIDPPKNLVVRGLYKYTRNPMYLSVLAIMAGESLLLRSAALFEYSVAVGVCFHLFVVFYEEGALGRKMGDAYMRYCEQVPRWLLPMTRRRRTHAI
jgi:protein-S-isoprenylcysteine O-methyltransferase Ste14